MNEMVFLREFLNSKVKDALEQNREIIIDSFAQFYGEEYRDVIVKRYEKIVFCYYLSWKNIDTLLKASKDQELIKRIKDFESVYDRLARDLKDAYGLDEPHPIEAFIGISDETILEGSGSRNIHENILHAIINNICLFSAKLNKADEESFLITLSIFTVCEDFFLHEIGHAVVTEFLAKTDYATIKKVGLSVQHGRSSRYLALEELINEKSNVEIKRIFKRRGGNLSCFPDTGNLINIKYREYFYLVDSFYEEFKDLIKKARITNNINLLVNKVGKENYERFVDLINECLLKDISEERKQTVIAEIEGLIVKMKSNALNCDDNEILEDLVSELESQGKRVRVLNQ